MAETLAGLVEAYNRASSGELLTRATSSAARIVTMGPAGTSSYEAAKYFRAVLTRDEGPLVPLELHDTFSQVLERAVEDETCLALVPSAYHGATTFHWHGQLSLLFHFVRSTPSYGLAARCGPKGHGSIRVAAMPEVEQLYEDLVPSTVVPRPIERIAARSTAHAAELVALGDADVAVTNDSSRQTAGLQWISSRPGAEIVWLIFGRTSVGVASAP